jgi:hypothetical protein
MCSPRRFCDAVFKLSGHWETSNRAIDPGRGIAGALASSDLDDISLLNKMQQWPWPSNCAKVNLGVVEGLASKDRTDHGEVTPYFHEDPELETKIIQDCRREAGAGDHLLGH